MIKCITICAKGYSRCCFSCELQDLCEYSCTKAVKDPKKCKMHVNEVVEERRTSELKKKFRMTYILGLSAYLTLIFSLAVVVGNQNAETIRETDILDKLNQMEQSIDTMQENRSTGNLTSCITDSERELIERVVMNEARGEDLQSMMGVAQTIRDRAHDWDMTISDVVQADGQYAKPYQGEITDEVHLAVANIFDGNMSVFDGGTYQFHDDTVKPYWTEGKIKRGSIGRMSFYGWYEK